MPPSPRQRFAVVMRMQGMFPEALSGYARHRKRKRAEKDEVDAHRSHLNRRLIGDEDWARRPRELIEATAIFNFQQELEELKRRGRKAQHDERLMEGPKDPWRKTRHEPLREVVLTASHEYFQRPDDADGITDSELRFEERAIAWLKQEFGEHCVHACADMDEQAYHIHAVIVPATEKSVNGTAKRLREAAPQQVRSMQRSAPGRNPSWPLWVQASGRKAAGSSRKGDALGVAGSPGAIKSAFCRTPLPKL